MYYSEFSGIVYNLWFTGIDFVLSKEIKYSKQTASVPHGPLWRFPHNSFLTLNCSGGRFPNSCTFPTVLYVDDILVTNRI